MNIGMGLRGPTGFVAAIEAAGANDARASALIGLFITGTIAIGTAVVAPFLDDGLIAPAIAWLTGLTFMSGFLNGTCFQVIPCGVLPVTIACTS